MRPLIRAPRPPTSAPIDAKVEWLLDRIQEIVDASNEEGSTIGDPYKITSPVAARRTLDATAGTLTEVREVVATLLTDMRRRGMNRGTG